MDFVRKLGSGETTVNGDKVEGQSLDGEWAGEYGEEGAELQDGEYWAQLEKEWQDLAK